MADVCMVGPALDGPCGAPALGRIEITCSGCRQVRSGSVCDEHAAQVRRHITLVCGWCDVAGREQEAPLTRITRTYTPEETDRA